MRVKSIALLALSILPLLACANQAKEQLKAYPAAEKNFLRYVFYLPTLEDESTRKIELIVGKTMTVDCNNKALNGLLQKRVITGWGYPYFIVEKIDGALSTMMACPAEQTKEQFVSLHGEQQLHRYNSKLPVVVYVPADYEVRYRIWTTDSRMLTADSK